MSLKRTIWRSCSKQNGNIPFRIRSTYRGNGPRATKWWREEKATGVWKAETMNNAGMLHAFIQDPGFEMSGDNAWAEGEQVRNCSRQGRTLRMVWYRWRRRANMKDAVLMKGTTVVYVWTPLRGEIMSAETRARGLHLSAGVTVRREIIPTLMSKYSGIITHQSRERQQTQPAVLGGKAGASSHFYNAQKNPLSFHKSFNLFV